MGIFRGLKVFNTMTLGEGIEQRSKDRAGKQESNVQRSSQYNGLTQGSAVFWKPRQDVFQKRRE